ncbi:MAG: hypothetical protein ACE5HO_04120 [bacterium]
MNGKTDRSSVQNDPLKVVSNGCSNRSTNILGCTIPADPELLAAGWERRFIADARMARDAIDTYGDLGYEVRLEPIDPEGLRDECSGCKVLFKHFSAVYTRKKPAQ